jgi:hypothetical protein
MEKALITRNTAAWRIWNLRFHVQIPTLAQYSAEYLRKNYINISGDRSLDKLRMNQLVDVKQTCAGLAMIIAEGYSFSILNRWDCVQMYSDIQEHFRNWLDMTYGGYPPDAFPPISDMRLLETVALEMHSEAQRLAPADREQASRIFEGINRMNRRRNLAASDKQARDRVMQGGQLKPYNSMIDQIEKYILG